LANFSGALVEAVSWANAALSANPNTAIRQSQPVRTVRHPVVTVRPYRTDFSRLQLVVMSVDSSAAIGVCTRPGENPSFRGLLSFTAWCKSQFSNWITF
jgi:hypothetical protein